MVDVFDEVEEELRRERYQSLIRKWGPILGAIALAVVLGVAGREAWNWRTETVETEASERFLAARDMIDGGNLDGADQALSELAEDGPRGYAALALMQRAALADQRGDRQAAMAHYEQAADRSPSDLIADAARYRAALAGFDELSYDDQRLRLEPLMDGEPAQAALARELLGAAAIRAERWEEARRHHQFNQSALDAPQGVRRRAAEALTLIAQNAPLPAADAAAPLVDGEASDADALLPAPEAAQEPGAVDPVQSGPEQEAGARDADAQGREPASNASMPQDENEQEDGA